MKRIILIYKRGRSEAADLAQRLVTWLNHKGIQVTAQQNMGDTGGTERSPAAIPRVEADAVVVLGGDGTFLSVARQLEHRRLPIIGVNLGGLGFLTEISRERCFEDLEQVLAGAYEIEERMRLQVSIERHGEHIFQQVVLNDVVINKGALARIVDLYATIDDHYLTHYRADGLIVATPTGSTAYNLSAGGPIVYPTSEAVILTPICPFTLTNRPIILPATVRIRVDLDERAQDVALTCDGQVGCHLAPSDRIHIRKSPYPLRFLKPTSTDYFEILRTKLKWGQN